MITHYLGDAEVDAYLRELGDRLAEFGDDMPLEWLPIGHSGRVLAKRLLDLKPGFQDRVNVYTVDYSRGDGAVLMELGPDGDALQGRRAFVLDSSVHSGDTMRGVVDKAYASGAVSVDSYALVLKRRSVFVPTFWGVTIHDHDRAYFLLDKLPNNRHRSRFQGVYLRRLTAEDVATLAPVECKNASMNRVSWADRWYDMRASDRERSTYLLSVAKAIVGYVTFTISLDRAVVTVDEVAVATTHEGAGLAGLLMRWAETTARQIAASQLFLWGIDAAVVKYEHMGYRKVDSIEPMYLDGETYFPMRKRILYHLGSEDFAHH